VRHSQVKLNVKRIRNVLDIVHVFEVFKMAICLVVMYLNLQFVVFVRIGI
jgi:hypothetical protein